MILRFVPPLTAGTIKLLSRSLHWDVRGKEHLDAVMAAHGHAIISIWHEAMGLAAWLFSGSNYHTLTSYSFDGELAARTVHHFGMEAVRGSSSRGGSEALSQLLKAITLVGCVGFTLDGPRGPRRVAKPGIAILAARSGIPIVPLVLVPQSAWHLNSWDRLPIPKPFTRVACAYGPPIAPPAAVSHELVESVRLQTETAMNNLYEALEIRPARTD